MKNLNEIFRKDVTHDNNETQKNQGYTLSAENTIFEKSQEWSY